MPEKPHSDPGLVDPDLGQAPTPRGFDRRAFLRAALVTGAVAGASTFGASAFSQDGALSRAGTRIPRRFRGTPRVAADQTLDQVSGITPWLTTNNDFYRIDTALQVPQIDVDTWTLSIGGMVDEPIELSFRDILAMPLEEHFVTLTCVSNPVGGEYVGNAKWLGVRLSTLLDRVGVQPGADAIRSTSVDGWTCGTPLGAWTDGRPSILAIGMNGEPLPLEHGFPARLVVPGLYGFVSATKWISDIEITRFDDFSAYWTERGWSEQAPIKTGSRIDTPGQYASLRAGMVPIAGVAWAQTTGITGVQVRVDEGPWQAARLNAGDDKLTWRQWVLDWDATPGRHVIEARSTDASGYTQTSRRADVVPDGATGWHSVTVDVT